MLTWPGSAVRWVLWTDAAIVRLIRRGWGRVGPRTRGFVAVAIVFFAGVVIGAKLAPPTRAEVGPLQVQVRVTLTLHPGVRLLLPPAGEVTFATHRAPFAVEGSIAQVDLDGARNLIDSPTGVRSLSDQAVPALRTAAIRAALTTLGCALTGALVLSLLVFRARWRRTAQVAITVAGALVVTTVMAWTTADPARLAQPRFTGLLSQAPYIAGQVPNLLGRLEGYRTGLADIIRSVTALYATTGALPDKNNGTGADVITVLHVSDIHLNPLAFDLIDQLVSEFHVDVVVDTGDIVTWGTEVESTTLSRISGVKVPYVFVRGNHDSSRTAAAVAKNKNAIVLNNSVAQVAGITIAGVADPEFTPDSPEDAAGVTASASASGSPSAGAVNPDDPDPATAAQAAQLESNTNLAATVERWDTSHPADQVEIAAVHEPTELTPLLGRVPTIFAGHLHVRSTRLDNSGTRIMIEGSTGGAGITARGLGRLASGEPLPLAASLVYVQRSGDRAGRVVATDSITVGGFGLSSINLQRTFFDDTRPLVPEPVPGSGLPTSRPAFVAGTPSTSASPVTRTTTTGGTPTRSPP